jgi:hypothetical protein
MVTDRPARLRARPGSHLGEGTDLSARPRFRFRAPVRGALRTWVQRPARRPRTRSDQEGHDVPHAYRLQRGATRPLRHRQFTRRGRRSLRP